jgi:hypothetical protein
MLTLRMPEFVPRKARQNRVLALRANADDDRTVEERPFKGRVERDN